MTATQIATTPASHQRDRSLSTDCGESALAGDPLGGAALAGLVDCVTLPRTCGARSLRKFVVRSFTL